MSLHSFTFPACLPFYTIYILATLHFCTFIFHTRLLSRIFTFHAFLHIKHFYHSCTFTILCFTSLHFILPYVHLCIIHFKQLALVLTNLIWQITWTHIVKIIIVKLHFRRGEINKYKITIMLVDPTIDWLNYCFRQIFH